MDPKEQNSTKPEEDKQDSAVASPVNDQITDATESDNESSKPSESESVNETTPSAPEVPKPVTEEEPTNHADEPEASAGTPSTESPSEISISSTGDFDQSQERPAADMTAKDNIETSDQETTSPSEVAASTSSPTSTDESDDAYQSAAPTPMQSDEKSESNSEEDHMPMEPKPAPTLPTEIAGMDSHPGGMTNGDAGKKPRRMLMVVILAVIIIALIGASLFLVYKATKKDNTSSLPQVKVGLMMAFTGGSSSMGYGTSKGIQLAKSQLGINNVEIVQMDSKCDPKVAADAVKRLIAQKVVAIIGEGCSSASVAALPAANNAKVVMLSPSASSTTLSIPDDYFFRVVPSDIHQGRFLAQTIFDRGIRKVAVFYTNEPYGSSINKVFQEEFESLGGKVVATASGESDVIDLNTQMSEIKAASPQAVFFAPNSVVSGTAAMKIGREVGITAPYFGADILYNTTIINDAPEATDGLTITSFPTGTKAFKQAIANLDNQANEQLYAAPQAYDALHAIYIATKHGASTGEEIKAMLPSIAFQGVSGRIAFDQNGDEVANNYKYDLLQVKNGKFEAVEQ
ncbi:MAG TPA: penicillin-binding protein activator [Candidatus Saccharimonadales bacterium]|nr:penicillin-binding protein activator [Candidatus Saccharimonadales bacterium]